MKPVLILTALLLSMNATATNKPPQQHQAQKAYSVSGAKSTAASHSASKSVSGSLSASQAVSGDVNAGDVTTGDVNLQGGDTIVDTDVPRQAPSIGLVVPPSTMDCSKGFGWGGSNKTGSMLLGWSWLQRDCMAMKNFELLRSMGLYKPAAEAYCARKLFRKPFADKDDCVEKMSIQPIQSVVEPVRETVNVYVDAPQCSAKRDPDAKGFRTSGKNGYAELECFEISQ